MLKDTVWSARAGPLGQWRLPMKTEKQTVATEQKPVGKQAVKLDAKRLFSLNGEGIKCVSVVSN
jgi:hypothetical protein